jgi:hypothetical protein
MTPQEQQQLEDFLQRLAAVRGAAKDPQADVLIQQQLAGHPDALYLLVQRCLLQQHALDSAKAQIAQLQAQAGGGSFLGGQNAWNQPQQPVPPPMPQQAAPTWRERLFGGAAPQQAPSAAPSFLASAATTAAGVAGGMFLFEGIEGLLGGHHGGGLFGGGGQTQVIENITENNNYYDDGGGNDSFASTSNDFNSDFADDNFDDSSFDDSSWS